MHTSHNITHVATVRGQNHADELAVLWFTGMTKDELFDLKYDMGKRWVVWWIWRCYCLAHTPDEGNNDRKEMELAAEEFYTFKEVLQLWQLEWQRMDREVIAPFMHKWIGADAMDIYRDMHLQVFTPGNTYCKRLEGAMNRMMAMLAKNGGEVVTQNK